MASTLIPTPPSTPWPFLVVLFTTSFFLNALYRLSNGLALSTTSRHRTIALFAWATEAVQLIISLIGVSNTILFAAQLAQYHYPTPLDICGLFVVAIVRIAPIYALAVYATHWTEILLYPDHGLAGAKLKPLMLTRAMLGFFRQGWKSRLSPVFVHEAAPLPPMPPGWYDRKTGTITRTGAAKIGHNSSSPRNVARLHCEQSVRRPSLSTPTPASKLKHVAFVDDTTTPSSSYDSHLDHSADAPYLLPGSTSVTPPRSVASHGSLPATPDSKTGFVRRRVMEMS